MLQVSDSCASNSQTIGRSTAYLRCLALFALLPIVVAAGINYYADPFQFFRKTDPPQFSRTMIRQQMPGVIRNYSFDAMILGNSLSANLRPSMFSMSDPPLKLLNLSMAGSTLNEVTLIANMAFRTKPVKTVFWAFGNQIISGYRFPDFPHCMYSRIFENLPYCYLLNVDILRESTAMLTGMSGLSRARWMGSLDTWQAYGHESIDLHEHACYIQQSVGSPENIDAKTEIAAGRLDPAVPSAMGMGPMVVDLLSPIIDAHPEVRFVFFFTPIFNTAFWVVSLNGGAAEIAFMKRELLKHPNVEVFDFQEAVDVTENPELYDDLSHTSPEVAARMASWLSAPEPRYRVTDLEADKRALQAELRAAAPRLRSYFDERCP